MIEGPAAEGAARASKHPFKRSISAIVLGALVFDVAANSVLPPPFRVPVGVATAAGISWLGVKAGVSLEEQGLKPASAPRGLAFGAALSLPAIAMLAGASLHGRLSALYRQDSVTASSPLRATYEALVRIPLGTALPEEMIFRGTGMAILASRRSPLTTLFASSALFGLWHIAPATQRLEETTYVKPGRLSHQVAHVAGSVLSTAAAGLVLGWMRMSSGSIFAPWMLHSAANSSGYVAAWLAARRKRGENESQRTSMARASSRRSLHLLPAT